MKHWFYIIRAMFRVIRGRWYVWRDAPTDTVRRVAALWYVGRHNEDRDVWELIYQAREEYRLRKQK